MAYGVRDRNQPRVAHEPLAALNAWASRDDGSCLRGQAMSLSQFTLKPVSPEPISCKICDSGAGLYGVVDFHKSCNVDLHVPVSGVPIYYRRCAACGFLFTDAFDDWSEDQFRTHIYNDGYHAFDPDYQTRRPSSNAKLVEQLWSQHKTGMRVLDFGGGNDVFCTSLRASGFPVAITYDPMVPEHATRPEGKFDLVTCFETLEHLPDPIAGIARIAECVSEPGAVFYSTMTQPADFDNRGLSWWYVGPRNGHISIFTRQALSAAWARHGFKNASLNDGTHIAFRSMPPGWQMG
jgi:2-polyprenyl-3-methyl-5-hydroxy-6-metoxy-1,4-benzoquinol methylase